jgi:hypothetical protein
MTRYLAGGGMLLSPIKETYHILLSSITIVLYVKEIFEKWRQVVNKNKNTKSSKQVKTAGDSTELSCVSTRQGYTSSTAAVDEPVINILRVLLSALEKYIRQ